MPAPSASTNNPPAASAADAATSTAPAAKPTTRDLLFGNRDNESTPNTVEGGDPNSAAPVNAAQAASDTTVNPDTATDGAAGLPVDAAVDVAADVGVGAETGTESGTDDSSQAAAQTESPTPLDLLERLNTLGFQNVTDVDDAQRRLIEAYEQQTRELEDSRREREQQATLANYGQQYLAHLAQQQQAQQAGQPVPHLGLPQSPTGVSLPGQPFSGQPQAPSKALFPTPPPAGWERYRERDEAGEVVWKANTPAEIRAQVDAYEQQVDRWSNDLVYRPQEALSPVISEIVNRQVQENLQQILAEQSQRQFIEELRQKNDWMYQRDPRTNQVAVDARTGNVLLTPDGQRTMEYVARAEQMGITNIHDQWTFANQQRELEQLRAQTAALANQQTAQQTAAAKKTEHLRRGAALPAGAPTDRAGSLAPRYAQDQQPPQNTNLTPGQSLAATLRANGNPLQFH